MKGTLQLILTPYVVSTLQYAWPAIYSWVMRPIDCSSRYMGYHRFSQPLVRNDSHCAQVSSTTLLPHDLRYHIMQIWFYCVHVQCAHTSGNSSRNLPSLKLQECRHTHVNHYAEQRINTTLVHQKIHYKTMNIGYSKLLKERLVSTSNITLSGAWKEIHNHRLLLGSRNGREWHHKVSCLT